MINPIAQLLGQAEAGLADFTRRTVESVTLPIRAKSQELVAEVSASVKASLRSIAIRAGLGLFAGVMLLIALGYALSALHEYLALRVGPLDATLIMAGVFLALSVIALVALVLWPSGGTKPGGAKTAAADGAARALGDAEAALSRPRLDAEAAARAARGQAQAQARAAEPPPGPMVDVKSGLGAIASALGEAGFRREQAGLRAGLAIADQLKPMQIVSLALLGGFIAGMRHRRRG